jgi:ribosomal protein L18E
MKNYSKTSSLSLQQFISRFEELPKKEKDALWQSLKATMEKPKSDKMANIPLRREVAYDAFDSFVII